MKKTWKVLSRYPADPIGSILKNRGIVDREEFLDPKYIHLQDPLKIPGLKKAVSRIKKAIKNKERLGIFCDYDADGIPGGAILYKTLSKFTKNLHYSVPMREEGYGLNRSAVEFFKSSGVTLLLTVDCGVRNFEEIKYAKELGIETIVTDHHQLGDKLPDAFAIIHPLIKKENKLEFRDYSGGGVAFMLARELLAGNKEEKLLLDLAAISTIADVVPLVSDNRSIVKFGLWVLNRTQNVGLRELMSVSNLEIGKIGTYEIGFILAPRINAAGRISEPQVSFELLTTSDRGEAKRLAKELNRLNGERQDLLEKAIVEAEEMVLKGGLQRNKIIVLKKEGWPQGIIGLVSAKITEKFYRPSIVISEIEGKMHGSARSIKGINITEIIGKTAEYLTSYGGHSQAAGLSLDRENFDGFERAILKESKKLNDKFFEKQLIIDALLKIEQVDLNLAEMQEKLEPFGPGNPRPTIALEDVEVLNLRNVGKTQAHAKAEICKGDHKCSIIGFNYERNGWKLEEGKKYDVAFSIKINEWNGSKKVDLVISDVHPVG